jgi:hypothetical protein
MDMAGSAQVGSAYACCLVDIQVQSWLIASIRRSIPPSLSRSQHASRPRSRPHGNRSLAAIRSQPAAAAATIYNISAECSANTGAATAAHEQTSGGTNYGPCTKDKSTDLPHRACCRQLLCEQFAVGLHR